MLRHLCASESPGGLLKHRLLSPLHPPSFCLNRSGKGPEVYISDVGTPGLGVIIRGPTKVYVGAQYPAQPPMPFITWDQRFREMS